MTECNFFNALQTKDILTENNAVTNSTTLNNVLDLFFLAGATRNILEADIEIKLQKAWIENKKQTLKLIFYAGDIREGLGERRFFRIALKWLEKNYKNCLEQIIDLVPLYNRWDSLFHLKSDKVLDLVANKLGLLSEIKPGDAIQFNEDKTIVKVHFTTERIDGFVQELVLPSLLCKWMPRKHNKKFKDFRKKFQKKYNLNDAEYRKLIVKASKTVEQQMSAKEWDKINYEHVPSIAFNKYRKAFNTNDANRYQEYIEAVQKGEKKINASAIFPYDIYRAIKRGDNEQAIIAQWNALPNYLEGINEKILPICDVSSSMSGTPMDMSVSLGIYFSERNNSIFKDGFITFSDNPKLKILKGTLIEKVRQLERAEWLASTNFEKVFDVILTKAKEGSVKEEDMPTTLLCISDMEFNEASGDNKTNFEIIKQKYLESGYKFPRLVFWNVNARQTNNIPIQKNDKAVLVSGATPSIIKNILSCEIDPIKVMEKTLNSERYKKLDNILYEKTI